MDTKRSRPDRGKISISEDVELKYWTKALGVDREMLRKAVDKVGNSAAAVRKQLGIRGGRLTRHGLDHGKEVIGAVLQLPHQDLQMRVLPLLLSDVIEGDDDAGNDICHSAIRPESA